MLKTFALIALVIILSLTVGILGLIVGMWIGGNYAPNFVLNGVQGYEATGQIGFIAGVSLGLLFGSWMFLKKRKN